MFTAGQEVFSSNYGHGVVTRILAGALVYPVKYQVKSRLS